MVARILETIGASYPLTKKDAGEFAKAKVSPMSFQIECYEAEGLGWVSVMTGTAMAGLMKMDTIIINPFDRDASLFSYDRIYAMGNDTLFLELYDTRLDRTVSEADETASLASLKAEYNDLADEPVASNWYDDIKYPCSLKKKEKKKQTPRFDELTLRYVEQYLNLVKSAPACDRAEKKKAASAYSEGLLSNGGPSTDNFVKAKGLEFTQKLFREVLFGTK